MLSCIEVWQLPEGCIIRGKITDHTLSSHHDPVGPLSDGELLWDCHHRNYPRWMINDQAEYEELL